MRNVRIYLVLAMTFFVLVSNVQAQGRIREIRSGNGSELRIHSNGRVQMHGSREMKRSPQHKGIRPQSNNHRPDRYHAPQVHHHPRSISYHRPVHHVAHHHRVDHRGFLPGWGGRVRYLDGRWGYLRHNRWYWYSCYFEPDYYFAHPVSHFHSHISPVAAGAIGGAVLGAFIGALCR